MSSVWKSPSLTGREVAWRWCAGLPILACVVGWGWKHLGPLGDALTALETVTAFKPLEGATTVSGVVVSLGTIALPALTWFAPLALLLWIAAGALGQNMVARRIDPSAKSAVGALFWLRLTRIAGVVLTLAIWAAVVWWAKGFAITARVARGEEPSILIFLAIVIVISILLFVGWAILSSPLELAQAVATRRGCGFGRALSEAFSNRKLRAQVMELGLVLCIVRIALLVLALVFSACPLPFSAVETAEFLRNWWIGVALWYLLMSDFFHVVRLAAATVLLAADGPAAE